MSAALGLYRLQLVDSRMDAIRSRLDEILQILENDEELRLVRQLVTEKKALFDLALNKLKQAEAEVINQKIKIEQSEARLYSGTVKNPKELQDIQNEFASLKRYLETLEERQLEAMLEVDATEEENQAAQDKLKIIKSRLADQNATLTLEQEELSKELERLDSERQAALDPLGADLVTAYVELRQQRRGLAVAEVSDGACAACGTTLTPSQNQSARSATHISHCPTCGRFLFSN